MNLPTDVSASGEPAALRIHALPPWQSHYAFACDVDVFITDDVNIRSHRRPRINKKWRKRYGVKRLLANVPYNSFRKRRHEFSKLKSAFHIDICASPASDMPPELNRMPKEVLGFEGPQFRRFFKYYWTTEEFLPDMILMLFMEICEEVDVYWRTRWESIGLKCGFDKPAQTEKVGLSVAYDLAVAACEKYGLMASPRRERP